MTSSTDGQDAYLMDKLSRLMPKRAVKIIESRIHSRLEHEE